MYIPANIVEELQQINCEELAGRLGMEVRRHKTRCFLHSESVPSLSFHPARKNLWHCFSCGKGGNAISLVMEYEKCGFSEACEKLCSIYGIAIPTGTRTYIPKKRISHKAVSLKQTDNDRKFDTEIAEWLLDNMTLTANARNFLFKERKLSEKIITGIGIKSLDDSRDISDRARAKFGEERCRQSGLFGEKGYLSFWTPCLIFPYRDKAGTLLGLQSRYLGENKRASRFQFLSGQKTHLFNLPILNGDTDIRELYITEGVTDCLAMLSHGKSAVAIPSATLIPESDLPLLAGYELRMMPDNDDAGWDGFVKLRLSLAKKGLKIFREDIPVQFKDYSEWYASGHK